MLISTQCDIFRFLFLSKQQPKTQRLLIFLFIIHSFICYEWEGKKQILTSKILQTRNSFYFLIWKMTETINLLSK